MDNFHSCDYILTLILDFCLEGRKQVLGNKTEKLTEISVFLTFSRIFFVFNQCFFLHLVNLFSSCLLPHRTERIRNG